MRSYTQRVGFDADASVYWREVIFRDAAMNLGFKVIYANYSIPVARAAYDKAVNDKVPVLLWVPVVEHQVPLFDFHGE